MADDTSPLPATEADAAPIAPEPATAGGGKSDIASALKGALNGDTKPVEKNPQAALRKNVEAALKGTQDAADGRVRGPDGKFAPKDATAADVKTADAAPVQSDPAQPAAAAIEAPTAWKKDVAAKHWATTHPEVQAEVLRREGDVAKLWEAHQQIKPLAPILGFANEVGQRLGIPGPQLVNQWANFQAAIMDPAKKVEAAQWLLKQYGIELPGASAAPAVDPVQAAAAEWKDPQVAALEAKLADFEKWKQTQETQADQFQRQHIESVRGEKQSAFEKFAAETSADGQPLRPHLDDAVMKRMATLIADAKTANPQLSDQDALQQAYEEAVWGNSTLRAKLLEDQRIADERKRNDEARVRAQAASRPAVSPATSSPQGPTGSRGAPPKDPRAHLLQSLAAVSR